VGDVSDIGNGDEHAPVSDPEQGCICVVAIDGKLRFRKPLARIAQPLTGF
jgi:putative transcriptional regulator